MDNEKDPGIRIDRVFLNKASFEHIPGAQAMPAGAVPADHLVKIMQTTAIRTDGKAGIITVRVQTTPESKGQYRFDVELMAMVSEDPEKANLSVAEYLKNAPAAMLFPFVREAVANLTGRGRFGPVMLNPVNFTRKPDGVVPKEQLENESPTS